MDTPIGYRSDFQNPYAPARSGPLSRLRIDPHLRLSLLFPFKHNRSIDVRLFGDQRYKPPLADFYRAKPLPDLNTQEAKQRVKHEADLLKRARAKLKTPVKLVPGFGGVDFAMAIRTAPGRPSLRRGVIRDTPVAVPFGRRPGNVPASTQDALAAARTTLRGPALDPLGPATVVSGPGTGTINFGGSFVLVALGVFLALRAFK